MSFMRTLATVAVGFAAAKGMDKYKQMGGMAGLQKMMQHGGAGGPGAPGLADLQRMAEGMGLGGLVQGLAGQGSGGRAAGSQPGANPLEQMMASLGGGQQAAGAAGLGGLMAALQGAAQSGGQGMDDMVGALFGGTPASAAMEENAKLMVRAMIQAAKADGEIDPQERQAILDQLGEVDAEERAFVERELAAPVDVEALARDTAHAMRAQVYATSLMAIRLDNQREAAYLAQLARALGLPDAERDRMHAAMGVPAMA
ncbi:tellurite resistance TerB family protein [Rhodovulum sp. 12E13]|uniref:DUF533 domain-containing protein n=1 Tax=Rhodovulum sp. 12E13 TaxID=2203891 RepID=UPI000E1A3C75|nr:DUF533 domain-containing protein [Rhodovulum sp. 12E13]RDC72799.1 tellurite resistance TerB family protein [Rhodovulum sp. 12E13]